MELQLQNLFKRNLKEFEPISELRLTQKCKTELGNLGHKWEALDMEPLTLTLYLLQQMVEKITYPCYSDK